MARGGPNTPPLASEIFRCPWTFCRRRAPAIVGITLLPTAPWADALSRGSVQGAIGRRMFSRSALRRTAPTHVWFHRLAPRQGFGGVAPALIPRWCDRFSVPKLHSADWHWVSNKVDQILCASFKKSQASRMKSQLWLDLNKNLVRLIVDNEALSRIMSCDDNFSSVSGDLQTIVTQASVGMHLFGHAITNVICATIQTTIDSHIQKMVAKATLDSKLIVTTQNDIHQSLSSVDNTDMLPNKRAVFGMYRGVKISATVKSIEEEVRFRMALAWKGLAVQQSVLNKLWCEVLRPWGCEIQGGGG